VIPQRLLENSMSPETKEPGHGWWEPVWELVVHILVGTLLFAVIFAPAILLDFLVEWLKDKLSDFLATLLTWTKYSIAVIDALLYVFFMVVMAAQFVIKLWRSLKKAWVSESNG
jgi:hypothetical protein